MARKGDDPFEAASKAVRRLDGSYLVIQGPPGTGKTHAAARIIVDLMAEGRRVGVSSHSHKAINHLVRAVEAAARERGFRFRGVKKAVAGREDTFVAADMVGNVTKAAAIDLGADLIAGTVYLFAREELEGRLDCLFVDEAGQVSLANLVAMGTAARNIVLAGDQMQLPQPIEGVHPGESGLSVLEYLLGDTATVPPDQGILLSTTWRLHPNICRFVSSAFYDGRLAPHHSNRRRALVLGPHAHPALRPSGISYWPVDHAGRSQGCDEEVAEVAAMFGSLMGQRYRDLTGRVRRMGRENVLVISPYNVQVGLLKAALPEGARVGTVDRFQGQEAEVVLISMATSSAEDMPRDIGFLFSQHRLNVAVSRARCLAVIVTGKHLLEARCASVEDLRMVNALCWAKDARGSGGPQDRPFSTRP